MVSVPLSDPHQRQRAGEQQDKGNRQHHAGRRIRNINHAVEPAQRAAEQGNAPAAMPAAGR
jgi:hypothetical protein